jgi:uncharacterized protein YjbI with pentapeptide repeats
VTVPDPAEGWSEVELRNESLTGEDLGKIHVTGSKLIGCELSGASLAEADLWRVELRECRMSGVVLDGARLRDVSFVGCKLDTATLRGVKAERVTFTDCVLREADLVGSAWSDSAFIDCDLDGATVMEARLAGTRMFGSSVERTIGADALRGVIVRSNQTLSLGLRVLDAMGVVAEDEEDGRS